MKTQQTQENLNEFLGKLQKLKDNKLDLSLGEDLSIAIMNLVSLEEHFFFTAAKTEKSQYYDLLADVREMRKDLLGKIVKEPEGEIWCISKHLLAASMRLVEVGTKYYGQGNKEEAKDLFSKAYQLYSLFWGINLKLIDIGEVKGIEENKINAADKQSGVLEKVGVLIKKLIDCCKE